MENKNSHHNGDITKCPYFGGVQNQVAGGGTRNQDWWPNQLRLNVFAIV
ncbi:MAG: hypothetical protein AAFP76_08845 [Bacteroidota bacterium]